MQEHAHLSKSREPAREYVWKERKSNTGEEGGRGMPTR